MSVICICCHVWCVHCMCVVWCVCDMRVWSVVFYVVCMLNLLCLKCHVCVVCARYSVFGLRGIYVARAVLV
jgi:hypothetical protein